MSSALSYYPNWRAFQQVETQLQQPQDQLIPFPETTTTTNFDYLFETSELFYPETCNINNSLLYDFSDNVNFPPPEPCIFQEEFEPVYYPKRHKPCDYEEIFNSDNQFFKPVFLNGFAPNPGMMFQDYPPPETVVPCLPDFPAGNFSGGSSEKKERTTSGNLSVQSIAARQRRRKITEKTQELGKLVPGGQKMNTAEMLQAAYKYIKYLQAQVGILEFMDSYHQEEREPVESEDDIFQGLLESPLIQEKLYSTEKCMVPQKFVEELSNDEQIVKSNPQLLQIVKQEH